MQKKFIRQAKPQPRPSPIINFENYTLGATPLERYRKHYMVFDYWNAELLDALAPSASNPKRIRRASQESLSQLQQMTMLLDEPTAASVQPLLEERRKLDRQLQDRGDDLTQLSVIRQRAELNQRRIHRLMSVSKVQERLRDGGAPTPPALQAAQSAADGASDGNARHD